MEEIGKRLAILAVVPARSGSKGVKNKNMRKIAGKSLVAMCGEVLRSIEQIQLAVVSTDSQEIVQEAERAGLTAPFLRPENLSGDFVSDIEVLSHALRESEKFAKHRFDIIIMIQPTSPMRKVEDVIAVLDKLQTGHFDSVFTLSETDSKGHPYKQFAIDGDSIRHYDERGASVIARQELTPTYHKDGLVYALTRECLMEQQTLLGRKASFVITTRQTVNIDTAEDLAYAEYLMLSDGLG